MTIEFEHGSPLILDRSLYRELVKQAIQRSVSEFEARVADQAAARQASRTARRTEPADRPVPGAADRLGRCTRRRSHHPHGDIWIALDRLEEAIVRVIEIGERHGLKPCSWGHAGDGNLHGTFMIDPECPA